MLKWGLNIKGRRVFSTVVAGATSFFLLLLFENLIMNILQNRIDSFKNNTVKWPYTDKQQYHKTETVITCVMATYS